MAKFKIATWNVNSLRVRLPHVLAWLEKEKPEVLALQEIKMPETDFPYDVLREAGYVSIASGQKAYNGVAILSKDTHVDFFTDIPGFSDPQRRILGAHIADIWILNLYIPNGESVTSEKYTYKLQWLQEVQTHLSAELAKHKKWIILGDFNIAPQPIDVHNPQAWDGKVLFSHKERAAFQDFLDLGFHDCYRELHPEQKEFSWWDYRMNGFKRNMGLRIDHILATHNLSMHCKEAYIDKAPRGLERPSDHAPVVAIFDL